MRIPVDKSRVYKQGFRTCGFCSDKSESFVDVTMDLRVFLKNFLHPPNPDYDLPYKFCLKCYKTATDAKVFRDRTNLAMTRLLREGRRDLFSKDRRRPKILLDWKDKHNAEKVMNRMARLEIEESPEDVAITEEDAAKSENKSSHIESTKTDDQKDKRVTQADSKISNSNDSSTKEIPKPEAKKQEVIDEQLSDAMEVVETMSNKTKQDASEDTSSLVEEEEQFPESGPYQCELCNEIFETKEEFLKDVKTKHAEEVDSEVIDALERDVKIREAKRKAGII